MGSSRGPDRGGLNPLPLAQDPAKRGGPVIPKGSDTHEENTQMERGRRRGHGRAPPLETLTAPPLAEVEAELSPLASIGAELDKLVHDTPTSSFGAGE